MEITPGYWRQRDGGKAKVAGVNEHANVAAYATGWDSKQFTIAWYKDGRVSINRPCNRDLIEPWVDRPEWPTWSVPPWINWIAQTVSGDWFGYSVKSKPEAVLKSGLWLVNNPDTIYIPPAYAPTWTGDWTKSLIERPKQS